MMEALRDFIADVILAFGSLVYTAQDPQKLEELLAEFGWAASSVPQPLLELSTAGSELMDTIQSDPGEVSLTQAIGSLKPLTDAIRAISTRSDGDFPSGIDVATFKVTIGRDLLDYFIVE